MPALPEQFALLGISGCNTVHYSLDSTINTPHLFNLVELVRREVAAGDARLAPVLHLLVVAVERRVEGLLVEGLGRAEVAAVELEVRAVRLALLPLPPVAQLLADVRRLVERRERVLPRRLPRVEHRRGDQRVRELPKLVERPPRLERLALEAARLRAAAAGR